MARRDPHSFWDDRHPTVRAFDWRVRVDFDARRLDAVVELALDRPARAGEPLDLDTRGLEILAVTTANGARIAHALDAPRPILGQRLRLELPTGVDAVRVAYRTAPDASAVQWLTGDQTASGAPFLFTQCQAIHARSLVPLQDSPAVRVTYTATLDVPEGLQGLFAAASDGDAPAEPGRAVTRWHMPEAVPPYLIALCVGRLGSAELGPRSRVWAEPPLLERAAHEFAEVDAMLRAAEALFGAYDWERFDLLVMPPSFPYGGMENPRLTFLTPTLLAGDRSLVAVVAHELAHSWTGNLVSGASAEHFWLNEGMTVWAERRIVEVLYGRERAELDAALGRRELDEAIAQFAEQPTLTHLRTTLDGIDPDEVFSVVPYEKGYLLARALEEHVGRDAFDRFVATYVGTLRFRSITTDDFVALVRAELPGALEAVGAGAYLEAPGVPKLAPVARSPLLEQLDALGAALPDEAFAARMGPTEWQLYLGRLPRPFPQIAELAARWPLARSSNHEIRAAFVELALDSRLPGAEDLAEALVAEVGRMKYLRPVYAALVRRDPARARAVFDRVRARYHPISVQVIGGLVGA
jgi:leukotriene-A4 hydrolase